MFSSKYLLFAALAAVGVGSGMGLCIQPSAPLEVSYMSPNESVPIFAHNVTQIDVQNGLNQLGCPCVILQSVVPLVTYLLSVLLVIAQALLLLGSNLAAIVAAVAVNFNTYHPTPGGWNCCSNCGYVLLNASIFIVIRVVVSLNITAVLRLFSNV